MQNKGGTKTLCAGARWNDQEMVRRRAQFRHKPTQFLLNHLVRPLQQRRRDREPEGLGRLEVDEELKLGGLLDWEVARFRTAKNLVDERRRATGYRSAIRPVG